MTTATLAAPHGTRAPAQQYGELALAFQEAFTVVVRLRSGRPVAADAASFRAHIKQLLGAADQRARASGYADEYAELAVYAFVALLDELVLGSAQPMFAEWSRQPLQEELFGEHMAGVNFFRNVQQLLARQDAPQLADLLEVYLLCLLLGFHGRYGLGDPAGLHGVIAGLQTKILRIRGATPTELAPDWALPSDEKVVLGRDPWARRLSIIAGGTLAFALLLYLFYSLLLSRSLESLQNLG
jgi:type VI secretion system protein ImpK